MNEIILCQPDGKKGCAVCCGLFNHKDISEGVLKLTSEKNYIFDNDNVRDKETYICPYIGFISDNRPGCTLHPCVSDNDLRDKSLFGKKICDSFLCPAHILLSESLKEILIKNIDNWYLYSIAIIDPESFIWIYNLIVDEFKVKLESVCFKKSLTLALSLHAGFLNNIDDILFYYSISEYNPGKLKFSLNSKKNEIIDRQLVIKENLKKVLF